MNIRSSVEDLRRFCRNRQQRMLEELAAPEAVRVMTEWYAAQRADGVELDEDGDMLLFQWGTGSWHGGLFGYDLTRQFIAADAEDDGIWQLSVTLLFPSNSETAACGSGDRWCHRPSDLDEFIRFVEGPGRPKRSAVCRRPASKSASGKLGDRPVRFLRRSPLRTLTTPLQFANPPCLGSGGPPAVLPVLACARFRTIAVLFILYTYAPQVLHAFGNADATPTTACSGAAQPRLRRTITASVPPMQEGSV